MYQNRTAQRAKVAAVVPKKSSLSDSKPSAKLSYEQLLELADKNSKSTSKPTVAASDKAEINLNQMGRVYALPKRDPRLLPRTPIPEKRKITKRSNNLPGTFKRKTFVNDPNLVALNQKKRDLRTIEEIQFDMKNKKPHDKS